ncbi:hypothetical protein BH09MYX1_BH09MYX1_64130 [soil metagenome]
MYQRTRGDAFNREPAGVVNRARTRARAHARNIAATLSFVVTTVLAHEARASGEPIDVLPTLTPVGDGTGAPHLVAPGDEKLAQRAQELDATLRDAVQDFGLSLTLGATQPADHMRDADLLKLAAGSESSPARWVLSPRIEAAGDDRYMVRIVVVPPGGSELRVRVEAAKGSDVSVRGLVLLRGLLSSNASATDKPCLQPTPTTPQAIPAARSAGRAIFAVNGALFGGFLAFSLQQAALSEGSASDPRVLYPLLLLGAGVGLGGTLLASGEWNVGIGDAWYLAGGAWWGAASGFFLASATDVQPLNQRYLFGAAGGVIGVGLATIALTRGPIDDAGAWFTHSGAAIGFFLGSGTELFIKGSLDRPPPLGQSIGIATGLLSAGLLARIFTVPTNRVLLTDLGIALGGLAGAAAASPFVFEDVTPGKTRAFLGITAGAAVAGGTLAYILSRNAPPKSAALPFQPDLGVIAVSPDGKEPAYGLRVSGTF